MGMWLTKQGSLNPIPSGEMLFWLGTAVGGFPWCYNGRNTRLILLKCPGAAERLSRHQTGKSLVWPWLAFLLFRFYDSSFSWKITGVTRAAVLRELCELWVGNNEQHREIQECSCYKCQKDYKINNGKFTNLPCVGMQHWLSLLSSPPYFWVRHDS